MRQMIDLAGAEQDAEARATLPSAYLESLQSLQEAYEAWKIATGAGVGVADLFWSWQLQV